MEDGSFLDPALKGRRNAEKEGTSIKHVLLVLVKLNVVGTEESEELGLEVLLLVMLGLACNVVLDGLLLECAQIFRQSVSEPGRAIVNSLGREPVDCAFIDSEPQRGD